MAGSDVEHVVRRPTIVEAVRPNTGNAAFRHLFNLVIREQLELIDRERIEPRVVRASAGHCVEIRN